MRKSLRRERVFGNRIVLGFAMVLLVGIFAGCGSHREAGSGIGHYAASAMEDTPIVDYVVPELTPNVLVNQLGYQTDSIKEAAVKGTNLPEEFRLVNADTGEVVYSGKLEKVTYDAEEDFYTGYAMFDDYRQVGTYYLECDYIGSSYHFSIVEALYGEMFAEVYEELLEECEAKTLPLSEGVALLTAYEWYPAIFPDENGDEVPDVLRALADWIDQYEESADASGQALQAAFLAKFSYLYQNYDRQYATACLQKASALYTQAQKTISKDAECFFALTELYRATGLYTYRMQITEYKDYFVDADSSLEETEYLYGTMTYMMTRQKVDMELCNVFIDKINGRGEEISERYEDMIHPVSARNNGLQDIWECAEELLFSNHVLNSYQYNNILKDFLHYLGGRNLESVIFYENENHGEYILLLAQLTSVTEQESIE